MPESAMRLYLATLRRDLAARDTTEESHYPTLKELVESLGAGLRATPIPVHQNCGAPDFRITKGDLLIGHIEAKNVGVGLDEAEKTEQIKDRYLPSLTNLILTNFLEFRWYVRGERRDDGAREGGRTPTLGRLDSQGKIRFTAQGEQEVLSLLKDFLSHKPQGALNARELAVSLSRHARRIHDVIIQAFKRDQASATLRDLMEAMQKTLLPDLTPEQFADMFAQTLVYGFFAAWCHHPMNRPFRRQDAAAEIPKTNPFLRRLFDTITGVEMDEEPFVAFVDDLILLLSNTERSGIMEDFGRAGRGDAVVHFYETFLKEYDPKLRELRGVYYTPDAVVSYMVRSVDHLLRTHFDCSLSGTGLPAGRVEGSQPVGAAGGKPAPRVLILDPACGTGGFLHAIIAHIRGQFMNQRRAGQWSSYVREHLLPRIFGFELLMAPYAVAHLKLGMQLAGLDLEEPQRQTWAYDFSGDERLGVFLTNTLHDPARHFERLKGDYRILSDEGDAANDVKRQKPIMVVIGNPPYSGHSANKPWEMVEKERVVGDQSETIAKRQMVRQVTFIGALLQDYYQVDGKALGERNPKWLQDDYVKFIRFGQWRIQQTGEGVLALITNHSYLDNPTFRGMRQQLMHAFSDIYLLDLHGNTKKKERAPDGGPDKNVFDIQQGVAIAIFVKERAAPGPARVWHADLWGTREVKEVQLWAGSVETLQWRQLTPASPSYLFVPQDTAKLEEYRAGWSLTDIFPVTSVGIVTARDNLTIHWSEDEVWSTVKDFVSLGPEDAREKYHLGQDVRDWKVALAQADVAASGPSGDNVRPVLYRPFDRRFTYYTGHTKGFICRPRREVMRHMLAGANQALIAPAQTRDPIGAFVTCFIAGHKSVAAYDINSLFPLYLYPDTGTERKTVSRDQQVEELKKIARAQHDHAGESRLYAVTADLFADLEYARWPNLHPFFLDEMRQRLGLRFVPDASGDLTETFGPGDVFAYIYAILHSPTYRSRYADFLKRDFPRIPLTSNRNLFRALVRKGRDLVALHLMDSPLLSNLITSFPEKGSDTVERVSYDRDKERVYINKGQYFDGVPREVWDFFVGGYQVCEKWLKDRKGRKLNWDDQQHYQKIVVALKETIRLMGEIDALIPGWPLG